MWLCKTLGELCDWWESSGVNKLVELKVFIDSMRV